MKTLKIKILIILTLMISVILSINAKVLGADATSNPKYIGITERKTDSGIGYAIGNPDAGGAKIWNIIEYQDASSSSYTENNLYCLKAGVGFTNVDKRATYNVFYNMKTEKAAIGKQNDILKKLVEGTIQVDNGTINQYSAILAVLDLFYYDGISDESYKENLLNAAGIHSSAYQYPLTNDDIEAVQQAALWYFTNYGENDDIYDQTGDYDSGWLNYTENGYSYTSLSDDIPSGQQRQIQAEILYKYLIRTAKSKAPEYDNLDTQNKAPIQVDTTSLSYEISNNRTIIGPIHISQNNIKAYELEFITKINNSQTSNYILLDENKSQVSSGTTVEDLIGEDFYISLPLESTIKTTVSIEININYNDTNYTLWASSTNDNEQPVLEPETNEVSIPKELKIEIPDLEGEYELEIVKQDGRTGAKLPGAIFSVNGENKTATNASGVVSLGTIQITNISTPDTYTIKEVTAPNNYNGFTGSIELSVAKKIENARYVVDTENTTMVVKNSSGTTITQNIPVTIDKTTGKITITVDNTKKEFDLALRKFIVAVSRDETIEESDYLRNEDGSYTRAPVVDASGLNTQTTAIYNQTKQPVDARIGDTIIYTIRVYNESEISGYAEEITDYLPDELEFLPNHEINQRYEWTISGNRVTTSYLSKANETQGRQNLIEAFDEERVNENEPLYYKDVQIACRIRSTAQSNWKITNLAQITEDADSDGNPANDRDSTPDGNFEEPQGSERPIYKDDETGSYIPGQEDDDDFEKVIVQPGEYEIEIVKQDGETGTKLSGAVFNVNGENKTATNSNGIVSLGTTQITNTTTTDTYVITETTGPEGYNKFEGSIELTVAKTVQDGLFVVDTANTTMVVKDSEGEIISENVPVTIDKTTGKITITVDNEKIEGNYVVEIVKKEQGTDIALPGAVFNVNGEDKEATNSNGILSLGTIEITDIETTDEYVITETSAPEGYNKFEGSIELSVGKKLQDKAYVVDTENTTMVVKDSNGEVISENVPVRIDVTTGRITIEVDNEKITGDYQLEIVKIDGETGTKLSGAIFNVNGEDKTATNTDGVLNLGTTPITGTETNDDYVIKETTAPDIYNKFEGSIELSVAKKIENKKYVIDTDNTTMVVKDSEGEIISENVPVTIDKTTGRITITVDNTKKEFDLALRKFIAAVSRDENIEEDEYLRNEDGSYSRAPVVDASRLHTVDENGNRITTAIYNQSKEPVDARIGDTVIYTIRVYNESELAGYAEEITDYLPDELEFLPDHEINQRYEWTIDGNRVTTDYLSKAKETEERQNIIEAFDETRVNEEEPLYYRDVQIACKIKDTARRDWKITNLAQITDDSDKNGDPVDDTDSTPDGGFEEPEGEDRPNYKDEEIENGDEYIPGQEDDDDFEKVTIKEFDLALRKFIIAVSEDTSIEDNEYLRNEDGSYTRAPVVDSSLLNTVDENGNLITTAIYNQTKEPVLVQPNNIVIYMLRVYNEGDIDGYAGEIKDHLPPYLEYVEGEFNDQYGWEVLDDGRTLTTRYLENSVINKIEVDENGETQISYQEVPVMCRIVEGAPKNENITNIADVSEYLDDNKEETTDRDSESDNVELPSDEDLPGYKDDETGEYIPGQQDDDDFEKVIVKEFDLALRKWVTQAIVIENGQETITETGHGPYDDPEEIVKVELHRKNINDVVVKFRYSIRVTNEGDIPGYVKEITDYVPEGLRFEAADNPGWVDEGNNVISTTLTEDILLQPGEYTEVEVVLTWINSEDNMGVMTNIAEISEDDNDYDLPDRDSTPDNQEEGEDDIDDAPVMISISTGAARTYFMLGGIVLITIAGGIILIKKFVI